MTRRTIPLSAVLLALACLGLTARSDDQARTISDREFAREAARGGLAEVKLGQLAVERAHDPAVKQFAQRMIEDHTRANKQLTALLKKRGWYPPSFTREVSGKSKAAYELLAKLTGPDFDRAYMQTMVLDHQATVALFQKMAKDGQDSELKSFAAKALPTLKEHLQLARQVASGLPSSRDLRH